MIRPELAARLRPWREVMAAAVLALAGAWLFSLGGLVFQPLGLIVVAAAVAWGIAARRRMPFQRPVDAPGVVEVVEGAIRYFGARTLGGEIALRDLVEVRLLRLNGRAHWRLRSRDGQALLVPIDAAGSGALADAFSALPGFDLAVAAQALDDQRAFQTVWSRPK